MQFLEKTMKNVRKHRDNKLVTTERRRKFISNRNERKAGLSIIEFSKILMYEF